MQIGAFLDQADAIQLKNDLMRRYATAKVIEFAGADRALGADQSEEPGQGDGEPRSRTASTFPILGRSRILCG